MNLRRLLLNNSPKSFMVPSMKKHILIPGLLALAVLPSLAQAACFASYKAKQDDPLQLHFGVAELPDNACTKAGAKSALAPRLANGGWILLSIVEMIPQDKLDEVKADAGNYFLRY